MSTPQQPGNEAAAGHESQVPKGGDSVDCLVRRFRDFRKWLRRAGLSFRDQDDIESAIRAAGVVGTEADVCRDISDRQAKGIQKYGMTVAANPSHLREWLQHAYEESLDKAIYLKRAIAEIDSANDQDEGSAPSTNAATKKDNQNEN